MIHNITLGNTVKSRRTKDVDIEPAADSSAADGGDDDGQSAQLGEAIARRKLKSRAQKRR